MPQSDAERLLMGPQVEPAQPAQPSGSSDADRLLAPGGMFGQQANPFMARVDETATRQALSTEFDFPEITEAKLPGLSLNQTLRLAGGLMFALDEAQQEDIVRSNIPDAELDRDRFGNLFVRIPTGEGRTQNFYINRPGMSFQDFTQLGAIGATAVPAGRAGAALGTQIAGPTIGRIAGGGAAEGLLSAGIDVGLQAAGSEQPVNLGRAGTAAVAGAAGEMLLMGLTRRLSGLRSAQRPVRSVNGQLQLSDEARRVVQEAGLDPDSLTQDFVRRLDVELQRAARPAEAVRMAEAASLPSPVPLTRGNVTRVASDQMFEDLASKGSFGRSVESIVTGIKGEQDIALRGNLEAIQERVAGGARQVLERGQGGPIAQEALDQLRRNANDVVQSAYRTARQSGQAGLPGRTIPSLAFNLERAAFSRVDDVAEIPSAMRQINRIRELGANVGDDGSVLVEALFRWRKTVTNLSNDLAQRSPSDARALADMRRAFDGQMVDIVERGLLEGRDDAVDLWLNAIRSRREFGNVWEAVSKDAPNYLVDRLTDVLRDGETVVPRVAPEAAANFIFGSSRTGLTTNPALARQLQRLRTVLVEGGREDAWNALREEAVVRLFNAAEGQFERSSARRAFSGARLSTAIDNVMTQNAPVMRALFNAEELSLLDQLKRVAVSVTTTTPGGANPSGTTPAAAQIFRSTFGKLIGRVFGPTIQATAQANDVAALPLILRAVRSGNARPAGRTMFGPGTGAALGAVSASQPAQEVIQR